MLKVVFKFIIIPIPLLSCSGVYIINKTLYRIIYPTMFLKPWVNNVVYAIYL